jgi:hypothetical protein
VGFSLMPLADWYTADLLLETKTYRPFLPFAVDSSPRAKQALS